MAAVTKMLAALVGALIVGGTAVLVAPAELAPAAAATPVSPARGESHCPGQRIEHLPVRAPSGEVYGYTEVHYDDSTGDICAMTVKLAPLFGSPTTTAVHLKQCQQTSPSAGDCTVKDSRWLSDNELYAAGPAAMYTEGRCFTVVGDIFSQPDRTGEHASVTGGPFCPGQASEPVPPPSS